MSEKEPDSTTAGSERIPQRRSEGVAGPSREVSRRDHEPSGAGCTERENEELAWARRPGQARAASTGDPEVRA